MTQAVVRVGWRLQIEGQLMSGGFKPLDQIAHCVQPRFELVDGQEVCVEVLVGRGCRVEPADDCRIADEGGDVFGDVGVVSVAGERPAALVGDLRELVGCGTPDFLGSLHPIAGGQLFAGVRQHPL